MFRIQRRFRLVPVAVVLLIAFAASAVGADEPNAAQTALDVADAQKANMEKLRSYSWRSNTTLAKGEETMATSVVQMRFDEEGKLAPEFLEGTSNVEEKRGVRGRAQKKQMSEAGEYLEQVVTRSFAYMFMTKGMLVDFFDGAEVVEEDGSLKATGKGVLVEGDEVTLEADAESKLVKHITFRTLLEADEIQGDVTYEPLVDGPSRPTQTILLVPAKGFRITTETTEFSKRVD